MSVQNLFLRVQTSQPAKSHFRELRTRGGDGPVGAIGLISSNTALSGRFALTHAALIVTHANNRQTDVPIIYR